MTQDNSLPLWKKFCLLFRPLFRVTVLRNPETVNAYQQFSKDLSSSSMVTEFNWSQILYSRFFRKVQTHETDLDTLKNLNIEGPIVYVIRNRGQLEYRFFNSLFLKENLPLVAYSSKASTVFWRPLKETWRFVLGRISLFFDKPLHDKKSPEAKAIKYLEDNRSVMINMRVSRDYLFGLIKRNPAKGLEPLVELQKKWDKPVRIVPLQFLYDKDPEKENKSLFDVLFGEKSCPGPFRKFLMYLIHYRKRPQAKFGEAINLQKLIQNQSNESIPDLAEKLLAQIENTLSIERTRITGPKLIVREKVINEALSDQLFQKVLETEAENTKQNLNQITKRAERYLDEIAADVNYSYVHMASVSLDYLLNNIYDGLVIKPEQLNMIRNAAGKNPIVLVPMHRSHIDYLLISHMFYKNNITFPHICSGKNLNFWPVGHFIRKCGGFFIRRNFDGNVIYKEALSAYVRTLINKGYCIEFFIEGTRSRTGKMLKPKLGFLNQIMQAYHNGSVEDVYFAPIAINYDQVIEQKAYHSESAGKEKKKENASELLKARKVMGKKYGKVYVEFADPLSLNKFYEKKDLKKSDSWQKLRGYVEDFGYELTYSMNKAAIITPAALVALAILSLKKKAFSLEDLQTRLHAFRSYLEHKGATFSDAILYSDIWAYNEALQVFLNKGFAKRVTSFEGDFYSVESQSLIQLDYYKNNIIHFFVSLTCLCKTLRFANSDGVISFSEIVKKYDTLKTILENDFTFSVRDNLEEHVNRVLSYAEEQKWVSRQGEEIKILTESSDSFSAISGLLDNYLELHFIVLRYIKFNDIQNVEKNDLVNDILEKAKPLYLKEEYTHPEALTKFNVDSSLKFARRIGLLTLKDKAKGKFLYSKSAEAESINQWVDCLKTMLAHHALTATDQNDMTTPPQSSQENELAH